MNFLRFKFRAKGDFLGNHNTRYLSTVVHKNKKSKICLRLMFLGQEISIIDACDYLLRIVYSHSYGKSSMEANDDSF